MGRQKQASLWGLLVNHPSLLGDRQTIEGPCLNKKADGKVRNKTQADLWPTHQYGYMFIFTPMCNPPMLPSHTCMHMYTHTKLERPQEQL